MINKHPHYDIFIIIPLILIKINFFKLKLKKFHLFHHRSLNFTIVFKHTEEDKYIKYTQLLRLKRLCQV